MSALLGVGMYVCVVYVLYVIRRMRCAEGSAIQRQTEIYSLREQVKAFTTHRRNTARAAAFKVSPAECVCVIRVKRISFEDFRSVVL